MATMAHSMPWKPAEGRKELKGEIETSYNPREVEKGWYDWWEKSGFFRPRSDFEEGWDNDARKKDEQFVCCLPPPNVTGVLHLGHALTSAVQDSIARWRRMKGHNVLWIPGSDHAGIATQVQVEKELAKSGVSRHDIGREEFVKKVWEWKQKYGGTIRNQLRLTGSSLDWSREFFTLDEPRANAVIESFCQLHERGIIKRSTRLINWCCTLQSAISDLEVEYEDCPKGHRIRVPGYDKTIEVGLMYHFCYVVAETGEKLQVATTRPETILGDTAVAIHPEDERYKHLHGKHVKCPFRDENIPIVLDSKLVNKDFGTGVVKVTPAHDPNDFECGQRNNLPQISMMDTKGMICMEGEFFGMKRFDCRKAIVEALKKKDLMVDIKPHEMRIGLCQRTKDIVEPLLMPQWFCDCTEMAERALKAEQDKSLRLIPDQPHGKIWANWLGNIKPWCISRQLWWGHRIPAYECSIEGKPIRPDEAENWIIGKSEEEVREKAKAKFGLSDEQMAKLELRQDEDVLDTWFSSGLLPHSALGWPNREHPDFKQFFPTTLLETGHDILFFWVARMVMTSLEFEDKLPFTDVYLHAMVRDREGKKMSKTDGNVVDPLDIVYGTTLEKLHDKLKGGFLDAKQIEKGIAGQKKMFPNGIEECGSDALRFGLLSYTVSGKNVNLDIERIVTYRHFCNKLWNAIRYGLFNSLGLDYQPPTEEIKDVASLPFACQWILSRLDSTVTSVNDKFANYAFADAVQLAYSFWLYDFCDYFVEMCKPIFQGEAEPHLLEHKEAFKAVLFTVLEAGLRLLHPMLPFITEELWNRLPGKRTHPSIMVAPYPTPKGWTNQTVEDNMKLLQDVVHAVRSQKQQYQLLQKRPDVFVQCKSEEDRKLLDHEKTYIIAICRTGQLTMAMEGDAIPDGCAVKVIGPTMKCYMHLKGMVDAAAEIKKLQKQQGILQKSLDGLTKKMNVPKYSEKVPVEVQNENTAKKEKLEVELKDVADVIASLEKML